MYYDNLFQKTIIQSLLYERRKKIDKIACSNNVKLQNFETITSIINSIPLKDINLEEKLAQTELNISSILDGTISGFTKDDMNKVREINEKFKFRKEQFSDFKECRLKREECLERELSNNYDLGLKIINHLDSDDEDFMRRYNAYVNFLYDIEEPLAKITLRKWENQLTKPNEYRQGCPFKLLVHAINTNVETALLNAKSHPIISTSLITDQFQGTYKNSEFGFVYQPNSQNVLLICSSDCYADSIPYNNKVSAEYFSLTSMPLETSEYLNYNPIKTCKSMHIEEIEEDSKRNQKGGADGITDSQLYNEIVLLNDAHTNPIAVFLLETGDTSENSVSQAKELALIKKLPLLRI